jgi:hypothetical protein
VVSVLGAPSPIGGAYRDVLSGLSIQLAEPTTNMNNPPNRIRTGGGQTGTLEFRRRITNNTGGALTALRLRFVDLTTLNSPGYSTPAPVQADLRPASGPDGTIAPTSIGVTSLSGLTLITPPAQPIGGGLNSVLLLPATPLAHGASVDVNIVLGISRVGNFRFLATVEGR